MQDTKNLNEKDLELLKIAYDHAKQRFKKDFISIGGALRTKSGKIFTGTNMKYHVRNLSICAEMLAIYTALDDGEEEFDTVVGVRYIPETDSFAVMNGCGKCRQLYLYHGVKAIIDNNGVLEIKKPEELLPYAFL